VVRGEEINSTEVEFGFNFVVGHGVDIVRIIRQDSVADYWTSADVTRASPWLCCIGYPPPSPAFVADMP